MFTLSQRLVVACVLHFNGVSLNFVAPVVVRAVERRGLRLDGPKLNHVFVQRSKPRKSSEER